MTSLVGVEVAIDRLLLVGIEVRVSCLDGNGAAVGLVGLRINGLTDGKALFGLGKRLDGFLTTPTGFKFNPVLAGLAVSLEGGAGLIGWVFLGTPVLLVVVGMSRLHVPVGIDEVVFLSLVVGRLTFELVCLVIPPVVLPVIGRFMLVVAGFDW